MCLTNIQNFNRNYFKKDGFTEIPAAEQEPLKNLVERILLLKKENPQTDTSALEVEIDRMVYKLYDLTEEEIAVVEGK